MDLTLDTYTRGWLHGFGHACWLIVGYVYLQHLGRKLRRMFA